MGQFLWDKLPFRSFVSSFGQQVGGLFDPSLLDSFAHSITASSMTGVSSSGD